MLRQIINFLRSLFGLSSNPEVFMMNDGSATMFVEDQVKINKYLNSPYADNITYRNSLITNYFGDSVIPPIRLEHQIPESEIVRLFNNKDIIIIKISNIWDNQNYNLTLIDYDQSIAEIPVSNSVENNLSSEAIYYFQFKKDDFDKSGRPSSIPDGIEITRNIDINTYGFILGKETLITNLLNDFVLIINGMEPDTNQLNNIHDPGGNPPGIGLKLPPKQVR